MRAEELLLYRGAEEFSILNDMCLLLSDNSIDRELISGNIINELYEYAAENGFEGNLWHAYLTEILVYNENPYTKAIELKGHVDGTVNEAAKHDFAMFKKLFDADIDSVIEHVELIKDYIPSGKEAIKYNKHIVAKINELSKNLAKAGSVDEFKSCVDSFYGTYGVGVYGLHKAFRVERDKDILNIKPIYNIAITSLDDLVGYEIPKKKLIDNTLAFLEGKKANNCLIFGESGTGKSSSIRAILNQYYDKGLRMIEVYKHQYQELNELIDKLKVRNYKFIIYMDDLSFEEFETEYKYLKAVIEGGLESKPDNVLIYATSNRRHLVRESFNDKDGEDVHKSETVQEKLSLFSRFGESIYFGAPTHQEFKNIVLSLAKRYKIDMPEDDILREANKWELTHGGLSGRTASQFIDSLRARTK